RQQDTRGNLRQAVAAMLQDRPRWPPVIQRDAPRDAPVMLPSCSRSPARDAPICIGALRGTPGHHAHLVGWWLSWGRTSPRAPSSSCALWASPAKPAFMIYARFSSAGQHLASVLQEGRENANIDAGLGFIWRIPTKGERARY